MSHGCIQCTLLLYCVCCAGFSCSCCGLEVSTDTCWFNTVTLHCPLQDEQIEWGKQELTTADIQQKVKEYNAQINSNLFMNMVSRDESQQMHVFFYVKVFFCHCNIFLFISTEQGWFLHRLHKGAVQAGATRVSSTSKERK